MAVTGMGTVLRFAPEGGEAVTVGRLSSVGAVKLDREEIDVTTLDSPGGVRVYAPGLKETARLELDGFFDGSDAGQAALRAAYESGVPGEARIVFTSGETVTLSAFVKSYSIGAAQVDGAVGFSAVLRPVGRPVFGHE